VLSVPTPAIFAASIVLAVALLAWQGTLADLAVAARTVRWEMVVLAVAGYGLSLGMLAWRWHALVRMASGTASAPVAAEVFLTSVVVNYAAPIGLAVPARAALSRRDLGLTTSGSGAVVMWEAALDLTALAGIGGLWLLVGGLDAARALAAAGRTWAVTAAVAAIAVFVTIAAVVAISGSIRGKLRRFAGDALALPSREPRWAAIAVSLTIVFWLLQLVILAILLSGVGVSPNPLLVLGLTGWPVFIGMISPVPGGAGVREALMVAVAGLARVDGAAVLMAALLYRMALFASLPLLYAGARLWRSRQPARDVREAQGG
jgi:uncharacterized protein (TIRG00374 family)